MTYSNRSGLITIIIVFFLAVGAWLFFPKQDTAVDTPADSSHENGLVEVRLGQSVSFSGVTITPVEVLEDSRCPTDVTCIQAGRVRLRASLVSGLGTADQTFIIGEPMFIDEREVTLVEVKPASVSTVTITDADYLFTFKVLKRSVTYDNASADMVRVTSPAVGAVTGKEFKVIGEARGTWYFEASFPIQLIDKDGNVLATAVAQAEGDWMTTEFVPFTADITVPESYIGPATLILKKDNPSGISTNDASLSFPITVEY